MRFPIPGCTEFPASLLLGRLIAAPCNSRLTLSPRPATLEPLGSQRKPRVRQGSLFWRGHSSSLSFLFFFFPFFLFHLEKLGRILKHYKKPSPVQLGAKALRLPS